MTAESKEFDVYKLTPNEEGNDTFITMVNNPSTIDNHSTGLEASPEAQMIKFRDDEDSQN